MFLSRAEGEGYNYTRVKKNNFKTITQAMLHVKWADNEFRRCVTTHHHVYNLIFYNFTWKHPDKNNKVYFVVRHFKFFFTLSRCLISRIAPSIWYFQTSPWSSVAWDFNDWIEKFIFILKTMTIEKHTIYGVSVGSDWAHTIYLSERSWV